MPVRGWAGRPASNFGEKAEALAVLGADCPEVPVVQGDDDLGPETLGQSNHRGVRAAKRKIGVLLDELADPRPVLGEGGLHVEKLEPPEKAGLRRGTALAMDQIGGLGDTEGGNHEAKARCPQDLEAGAVR